MTDRCERRLPKALPVRIWGVGSDSRTFLHSAETFDVSRLGARLAGVEWLKEPGGTIGVQHGKREKQFRVVWVGHPDTSQKGQAGLQGFDPGIYIWGVTASGSPAHTAAQPQTAAVATAPAPPLSSVWTGGERRQFRRYRSTARVYVSQDGTRFPSSGTLTDISLSGCYVEMDLPLSLQAHAKLLIYTDGGEIRARGIVRLRHDSMGVGVEFTEVSEGDRTQFDRFVKLLEDG